MDLNISLHEVDNYALSMLNENSTATNAQRRCVLRQLIDGDVFFPIAEWPQKYRDMFERRPMNDSDTFQIFLFFIGNGGSPHVACEWTLLSQFHSNDNAAFIKRCGQLKWLISNVDRKLCTWFTYNMYEGRQTYLNGILKWR